MRQKSPQEIARARQAAARRQARSLLEWLDGLRIERRAEALQRLLEEAEAAVRSRIAEPLIARAIPAMLEDPGHRQALADEYMRERVRRWPILNALHGLIAPIAGMARTRLPRETLPGSELDTPGAEVAGRNLRVEGRPAAELIQSVFARLRQAHPALGEIYTDRKPWDEAAAREMAAALRQSLGAALESQRGMLRGQVRNPGGLFQALGRGVLTIGAAIWFPFAQPLLESYLSGDGFGGFALLLVQLLGVSALLKTIAFLAIYFAGLWVFLKWSAQRRVDGWIQRGRLGGDRPGGESPGLNALAAQWADGLCEPIRLREDALQALARRLDELKRQAAAPLADR